jgi:hypothetical protein
VVLVLVEQVAVAMVETESIQVLEFRVPQILVAVAVVRQLTDSISVAELVAQVLSFCVIQPT